MSMHMKYHTASQDLCDIPLGKKTRRTRQVPGGDDEYLDSDAGERCPTKSQKLNINGADAAIKSRRTGRLTKAAQKKDQASKLMQLTGELRNITYEMYLENHVVNMRHDTSVPDSPFEGLAPGRALTQDSHRRDPAYMMGTYGSFAVDITLLVRLRAAHPGSQFYLSNPDPYISTPGLIADTTGLEERHIEDSMQKSELRIEQWYFPKLVFHFKVNYDREL
ncbi:hypothetical protein EK21DRAFT_112635 [Setomelanomma holmii]|uniref:Uncharacterized protein n=1 Tax=Setomelanomma holmii TaxID=210430 RepID=A0A9P4LLF7_9PLEO|nr:hypothetical protein EK21DRAFT_112635 [Setomelanomma holmii]